MVGISAYYAGFHKKDMWTAFNFMGLVLECNHTNVSPSKCAKRRLIYVPETPEEKLREAKAFPIDNEEIIKQTPIGKIRVGQYLSGKQNEREIIYFKSDLKLF